MKLSTVILAKNEEKNIIRAIESVEFSDEILVIDDFSIDKTAEIAKKMGVLVLQRRLEGDFSNQRNFGLQKSRGEWVLFLDADEYLSKELQREIGKVVNQANGQKSAYHIKRRDYIWGRELLHGELRYARKQGFIRLVKKGSGKWFSPVHEVFVAELKIGKLKSFIDHYPHPTVGEFLSEINFYSTLRAKELLRKGESTSLLWILVYPKIKFIMNYFIKFGFLDGSAGFLYAFMMSFHSFLVRVKLYQYSKLDIRQSK